MANFAEGLCNEFLKMNYILLARMIKYHLHSHEKDVCAKWMTFDENR